MSKRQRRMEHDERTVARRLINTINFQHTSIASVLTDPPDILLHSKGHKIGVEVVRATDPQILKKEGDIQRIMNHAYADYCTPKDTVITVSLNVSEEFRRGRIDMPPQSISTHISKLTAEVVSQLKPHLKKQPLTTTCVDISKNSSLREHFRSITVILMERVFAEELFQRENAKFIEPWWGDFDDYVRTCWKTDLFQVKIVSNDEKPLLELVRKKSKRLKKWSNHYNLRWLAIAINGSPDMGVADFYSLSAQQIQSIKREGIRLGFDDVHVVSMVDVPF